MTMLFLNRSLETTQVKQGLFLILVGRAQARVWDVGRNHHIEPKKPIPYVNYCSFHILDPDRGHIAIKVKRPSPVPRAGDAERS